LTDEQKANRVTVSQELFDHSNADENFLKNVVTGDETWVYGYDIETKATKESTSESIKCEGVVVPRGQTVNGQFYLEVVKRLREAERGVEKQDLDAAPRQRTSSHP
jgi:hypothetical protein